MADIPSAAFVFDEDLACELETEDFLYTEGIFTAIEIAPSPGPFEKSDFSNGPGDKATTENDRAN